MILNNVEVMFGGQAGDGSLTTGDLIAGVFKRMGLEVYTYKDFPSRIRGGHTNYVIRAGERPDYGMADAVDALVAFDLEAVEAHLDELRPGAFVVFDNTSETIPDALRRADVTWYEIPLARLAKEVGLELVRNTIALGVLGALLGMDREIVRADVRGVYGRKGEKVVDLNLRAIAAGEQYVAEHFADRPSGYGLRAGADGERLIMMGNDAIAYGALVAGCRFMAGYPITPATDILEWMAKQLPRFGGVAVQAEDELAAITMTLGASFTGVRAMTATSGPGQALMTEAIGLAGVLEIPVVVIECARAGPSTGMPTKTEQSNLDHLIYSGHGEIPRVVLAPGTVGESFELTTAAFNLAERWQLPVFVLTEQALCQSKATLAPFDLDAVRIDRGALIDGGEVTFGEYQRYAFSADGVSPRVIPGVPGGMHLAAGSEHNEAGVITENARNRARMMEKRMGKLEAMRDELPRALVHGVADADLAIVGYGANRGPIAEAVDRLGAAGVPVRFLQLRTLWPFPEDDIRQFVRGAQHVFVVENNYGGQLERLIRSVVGPLDALHGVRKYDGRPFRPIEVIEAVRRIAATDDPTNEEVFK
ncbi:MAG: 2-oxoglutarate/2-oxoacid ferredoxin oxidoreductase subunit alpha [Candidatus Eremiobacteraeota bacterium]|nr:2-oxoglutarate/2-oxoacid ferredoxin oxidoreductase subunit alpha [Candidatus Eremiobacteraeota bacterium]